jgi:hypothetical protein
MTSLLDTLNTIREENIIPHVDAAKEELKTKVAKEPCGTRFFIYAGCPTDEIGLEVAQRLKDEGLQAEYVDGTFYRHACISIAIPKADEIKPEEIKEIKEIKETKEIKSEEPKVTNFFDGYVLPVDEVVEEIEITGEW